ncbi:RNase P/RNase MRP subunit p30-like protein [Encephalitozoon hellem ATCC 50504]|uniref:Ribonuclease P/MRP protein subunit RPP1 n=1 Tax=Encephalitozoon hellem TaxID=27973 RepID=A0A9Q9C752_ENCHE|nr:RNase P/RNase MRP subunit p30-like protein [Encephalitozoon hellem ATCC 50504]AFM98819.1 RNase P/RNase MRP subunit p30-like protein [Encephalitozoon hellem ATCC 50504]UTX43797.1 ribonuclease P/MRP protein subunit RPP1 [Encephalitozoon hellem]|eukprot:XP_003887800.1 RNase P/RNase MRP subunit p30-like protein [Encephalitozoon hellem ATCC 50504]
MYFDTNVSSRCLGAGMMNVLEQLGHDGMCVNTVVDLESVKKYRRPAVDEWKDKNVYERVEIRYRGHGDWDGARRMIGPDVVAIRVEDMNDFKKAIEMCPDIVTFDYSKSFCIRRDEAVEAMKRNIFFEIPLVCGLYGQRDKAVWMRNARRLLDVTEGVNVVVGSGATCLTEMRRRQDVIKILRGLGMSEDGGRKILLNSARLVRSCDVRRGYVVK